MSAIRFPIGPAAVGANAMTAAHGPLTAEAEKKRSEITQAAKQFEGIFVRQLLDAAKVMGSKGSSGYGAMGVEGLADGVVRAGGLGLAHQIELAMGGGMLSTLDKGGSEKSSSTVSSSDETDRSPKLAATPTQPSEGK